jgi:hypothetical protein
LSALRAKRQAPPVAAKRGKVAKAQGAAAVAYARAYVARRK